MSVEFISDHGYLPPHFSVLSNELIDAKILICPGTHHVAGRFGNADSWADYTLIDWSVFLGTNVVPNDYPIAYDRFMSNHRNQGVNVLTIGGLVRWDSEAKWLKKFGADHPNIKLTMPE